MHLVVDVLYISAFYTKSKNKRDRRIAERERESRERERWGAFVLIEPDGTKMEEARILYTERYSSIRIYIHTRARKRYTFPERIFPR